MAYVYPHMCCDDHLQIGHSDSSSEMCPLCRALDALQLVDDMWTENALNFADEMKIGTPVGNVWRHIKAALESCGRNSDDRASDSTAAEVA